jgi:hypothetical protein
VERAVSPGNIDIRTTDCTPTLAVVFGAYKTYIHDQQLDIMADKLDKSEEADDFAPG